MALVDINSKRFWTQPDKPVQVELVQALSEPIRTIGEQRRSDNRKVNRYVFDQWTKYGLGINRMRREKGLGLSGLRDAEAHTCFASQITLPLLKQTPTDSSGVTVQRLAIEFKGTLYVIGEDAQGDTFDMITIGSWAGATTTWGSVATVYDPVNEATICFDAAIVGGVLLVALGRLTGVDHAIRRSTNGTSWSNPTTDLSADLLGASKANHSNVNGAVLVVLGADAYCVVWNETAPSLLMHKSTNSGVDWTTAGTQPATASGPTGRAVWFDLNGDPAPVIGTGEGVWAWDVSAAAWQKLWDLPYDANNCRGMTVARGKLYVPTGDGGMLELSMVEAGVIVAREMGPNRWDGLVSARQGYVTCKQMAVSNRFMDAAYGGHAAGQNASILRYDFENDSWHHLLKDATANQKIDWLAHSTLSDSTQRLHFGSRIASDNSNPYFQANTLANPGQGGTFNYEATGHVEWAEDDLGDPHTDGVVLRGFVDADDLSASTAGEYIAHKYGLNGAAWDNATLGNYLSGDKDLDFGTSSRGTSAKTIRHRLEFNRAATTTNTPKLKEFEVQAKKRVATLYKFGVPIDLELTAQLERRDSETVISDIQDIVSSVTLVPFVFGQGAERQVEAVAWPAELFSTNELRERGLPPRTGTVMLWLEEVLA